VNVTVSVDSIEDAIKKATDAGGTLKQQGTVPGMGEFAYVLDPAGNIVGLWHDANGA
jgi:predicted enzyme related to lactoylglutathione lyase